MKIILASASPRRKELLARIVNEFGVIPAVGEEDADKNLSPEKYVCALAEKKCEEVFGKHGDCLVIACDTVVAFGGKILGKPKDAEDAAQTLRMLSGNPHEVYTGVCVRTAAKKLTACDMTEVRFNNLTEKFIKEYVAGGSPLDKAGSYGIQDNGVVQSYKGSYTNVVGFPVELASKMIEEVLKDEQNCC